VTTNVEWDDHKQQERTSWSKIYASFFKTSQLSRSTDMAPYAATGLTTEEATEFFKLLNNANDYLRERA
jgi:hypothetical protein